MTFWILLLVAVFIAEAVYHIWDTGKRLEHKFDELLGRKP